MALHSQLHFCKPCMEGPTLVPHVCQVVCKRFEECQKLCECGEQHVQAHMHGQGLIHVHAAGDTRHVHLLRAICNAPRCRGCATHDLHPLTSD